MKFFSDLLLKWYESTPRELPWKNDPDAYSIWLSEIIMQQTQVAYGTAYYLKFKSLFPTISELSNAKPDKILKAWEGLGYYSRARNLHKTAQVVENTMNGEFPDSAKELEKLSGIGPYTAAAIASFAFNEQVPAIDGNAYRVLSRVFKIDSPIDSTLGKKQFKKLATELLPKGKAADFNQAIMNFGAIVCKPKAPDCQNCPLQTNCLSFTDQSMLNYPVKKSKVKVKTRYFNYFIVQHDDEFFIKERSNPKDVWQNLYEFSLVETDLKQPLQDLLENNELFSLDSELIVINTWKDKQRLSHQLIHAQFVWLKINDKNHLKKSSGLWVKKNELNNYAFPKILQNVLKKIVI